MMSENERNNFIWNRGYIVPAEYLLVEKEPELVCTSCTGIIRDAVQSLCGHRYCRGCLEEIIQGDKRCEAKDCAENDQELEFDDISGERKYYYPDAFARKKVSKITALCENHCKGCGWKGTLVEWEKHTEQCDYSTMACPDCEEVVPKNKWKEHEQACPKAMRTCPLAEFGCTKEKMPLSEWNRHNIQNSGYHLQLMAERVLSLEKKVSLLLNPAAGDKDRKTDGITEEKDGSTGQTVTPNSLYDLQKPKDIPDQMDDSDLVTMVQRLDSQNRLLIEKAKQKDKEVREIFRSIVNLEGRYLPKAVGESQEDFGFRLMLEESHSYNGELIWRIPNFKQHQEDAKSHKSSSIYSLPFYTSRYGYKMCLRLYPYGDGSGKGTHLSLFIVIMRGEYDDILEWPYRHKVTFQLLNLKGGKDIIDAFRADPESSSFKRPVSDMNMDTGCPHFAQLDTLQSQGFIANDTVYIRAKVEPYNGSKLGPF